MAESDKPMAAKGKFIRELAWFLVQGQDQKYIELKAGLPHAKAWFSLRRLTPLTKHISVEEAEDMLGEFLA